MDTLSEEAGTYFAASLALRKIERVDVKKQRRSCAFIADFWIKYMCLSVGQLKLLRTVWIFVQQIAKLLRVLPLVCNGQ